MSMSTWFQENYFITVHTNIVVNSLVYFKKKIEAKENNTKDERGKCVSFSLETVFYLSNEKNCSHCKWSNFNIEFIVN